MGNRRKEARSRVLVIHHVPDGSIWNRLIVGRPIHSQGQRAAASKRARDASAYAGNAEVVAENRNACLAHSPYRRFDVFDLFGSPRAIQKNVVPDTGIEVLNCRKAEAGSFDVQTD